MSQKLVPALALLLVAASARAEEPAPQAAPAAAAADPGQPGVVAGDAPAEAADDEAAQKAAFEASLHYKEGDVVVGDNLATLHLGNAFRFLGPEETDKVLTAWGNPPGQGALGLIFPAGTGATTEDGFAVMVSYTEEGHVEDDDAKDIDYEDLLADMKKATEEANPEREKQGYGTVHLIGWAEPPHYDAGQKKLYWAKELDFGNPEHGLNYDIRVLGRKGVLELSALSSLKDLGIVKAEMPKVLKAVEFNQGSRYADFNPDMDEVAAYGIGALVAGKVAAKAGLLKVLFGALVAGKKFLAVGAVALAAAVKKLFGKKDEGEAA